MSITDKSIESYTLNEAYAAFYGNAAPDDKAAKKARLEFRKQAKAGVLDYDSFHAGYDGAMLEIGQNALDTAFRADGTLANKATYMTVYNTLLRNHRTSIGDELHRGFMVLWKLVFSNKPEERAKSRLPFIGEGNSEYGRKDSQYDPYNIRYGSGRPERVNGKDITSSMGLKDFGNDAMMFAKFLIRTIGEPAEAETAKRSLYYFDGAKVVNLYNHAGPKISSQSEVEKTYESLKKLYEALIDLVELKDYTDLWQPLYQIRLYATEAVRNHRLSWKIKPTVGLLIDVDGEFLHASYGMEPLPAASDLCNAWQSTMVASAMGLMKELDKVIYIDKKTFESNKSAGGQTLQLMWQLGLISFTD